MTKEERNAVIEKCAQICVLRAVGYGLDYEDEYSERAALACAEAIRELKYGVIRDEAPR